MLDTNICSFIMHEQPEAVLKRLEQAVLRGHRIVVSAITYSYRLLSHTALRAVYFSVSLISEYSHFARNDRVHVIDAVPLVKGLIAGLFINDYHSLRKRKMALLLMEINGEAPSVPAELPVPQDARLLRAAEELMLSHRWETPLTDMADIANMSERSFSRLFLRDTGFSFRTWKQRARIYASLVLLSDNVPVKQIAWQLGFSSPAAYSAAFRAVMGINPGNF
ncbi:TPA: helix-turn-helix domain-containing protein [Klebsiella pneumoniae]